MMITINPVLAQGEGTTPELQRETARSDAGFKEADAAEWRARQVLSPGLSIAVALYCSACMLNPICTSVRPCKLWPCSAYQSQARLGCGAHTVFDALNPEDANIDVELSLGP